MATPTKLNFEVREASGTASALAFETTRLIIAGWSGRDEASLRHHIAELADLGIAPPSKTPLFYAAAQSLLTQSPVLQVLGADSSGEVEPLLLRAGNDILVGLASDHTDRKAEAWSVPHSKQLCGKPVAKTLWRFSDVAPHWDQLVLRSWIPGTVPDEWVLYQSGAVAALRRPDELAERAGDFAPGTAMLCGTLSAIGGIRPAPAFRMQLHDPVLGRTIDHEYGISPLPIVT